MSEAVFERPGPMWAWRAMKERGHRHARPDDLERMAMLRHLGGRGGPFGPPFGPGRGRRRRGDVRLALLLLLQEEPRNGYQLMQAIEERSGGAWRPSPGSVYPTLSQLEDEGLVRSTEREGGRVFEITDAGRAHLAERGEVSPPWEEQEGTPSSGELKSEFVQLAKAFWQVASVADEQQLTKATEIIAEARRSLYRLLAEDADE